MGILGWIIGGALLYLFTKSRTGLCQRKQYANVTQPLGTPVQQFQRYGPDQEPQTTTYSAPTGACTIARAGACIPCSPQNVNPRTPQATGPLNKPAVPTGVFISDTGAQAVIALSDTTLVQWYDGVNTMIAQTRVPTLGATSASLGYSAGITIDHAVLTGPGGSTIVINGLAPKLTPVALNPSPGSPTSLGTSPQNMSPLRTILACGSRITTAPILPLNGASAPYQSKGPCVPPTSRFVAPYSWVVRNVAR